MADTGETSWKLQMGDTNTDPIEEFNLIQTT